MQNFDQKKTAGRKGDHAGNKLCFHRTPVKKIWVPVEATSDVFSKWRVAWRPIFYRQLKVSQLINDVKTIALWIIPGPVWCFGAQYVTR